MHAIRLIILFLSLLGVMGFVVEGPRGGAGDALDHLERAPRWALSTGSLVDTQARGLGGGLEYSIDDSLCGLRFIDASTCDDVKEVVVEAFAEWASGHPALNFVDVSDSVPAAFPLAATREQEQGAEIDIFAATGRYFPPFQNAALNGYTIFYEGDAQAITLTNGQVLPNVSAIQSADIRLNADRCYYIDPQQGRPNCVHFPSLLLHEVGHAIGLGHPEENPHLNLNVDAGPDGGRSIDCRAPYAGLRTDQAINGAAVMIGRDVQGPGRWARGLTQDDALARDALYPHCGIQKRERFSEQWGAHVISENGIEGRARFDVTSEVATKNALAQCRNAGGVRCDVVASFYGCFALAEGVDAASGYSTAPRSDHARAKAVLECQDVAGANTNTCRIVADYCAFE
jgi:hypothetical protein